MSTLQEKSKEFLDSIVKLKKLTHKGKESKDLKPEMMMAMRIICVDYLKHKDDEIYYGMKTSDLTKSLHITKPATSKILNALEEKGHIHRSSNKSDRRIVYVNLTKEGKESLQEQTIKFENFICKIVDKMGEKDTDELISLFNKLYDVIEEIQLEE